VGVLCLGVDCALPAHGHMPVMTAAIISLNRIDMYYEAEGVSE